MNRMGGLENLSIFALFLDRYSSTGNCRSRRNNNKQITWAEDIHIVLNGTMKQ
jgi:hypothetical protein